MKKVAVASLGCSKNLVDTENMLGILKNNGYEIVDDESTADVIIVNTCSFINDAKQESIDTILDMAQCKENGACKRLIVTGCLAQRYQEEIINELPEVDAVVGVGEYQNIVNVINGIGENVLCESPYSHIKSNRIRTTPSYTAYLKIADGCDNCCTYCVIPSIRGKYISRPIEELVQEAKEMADSGVKELIIIAQDTTNYGMDLYGEVKLCELLKQLCMIDGLKWIRLHYCYPERITDELIDFMASNDKICKYLDIPIQHANDEVLGKMGRLSDKKSLVKLIKKLRNKMPAITLRTTLITGFPTETDEQFNEMADFVKEMEFDRLGVFAYSQEEETIAGEMDGQVDDEVKLQRSELIMLLQGEINEQKNNQKIGSTVEVLVEGYDSLVKQHYGRSEADSIDIDGKVFFTSPKRIGEGEFVNVKITESMDYDLFGELNE